MSGAAAELGYEPAADSASVQDDVRAWPEPPFMA